MQLSAAAKRLLLVSTILGSGIALLDTSVVNVALPTLQHDLGGGLAAQQWVANAYLLTLGSLILVGGSLGDLFGPRRVFAVGVGCFAATSLLCALAPSIELLVAGRALQGVASALMTPGALAIIVSSFPEDERGAAIGSWTAWIAIAAVIGPVVGGGLLAIASWRWIFLINVPFAGLCLALLARVGSAGTVMVGTPARGEPGSRLPFHQHVDVLGGVLCAAGLAGVVFALIEQPRLGFASAAVLGPGLAGIAALGGFLAHEARAPAPMLTLSLFSRRNFAAGNAETFVIYGGLGTVLFFLGLFLQQVAGYSPLRAGLATVPTTVVMFALSRRIGSLATRLGPRRFMAGGPLLMAIGVALMLGLGPHVNYLTDLLPALVIFALGLSVTVAPLTAAVLTGVEEEHAGIASGINNAIARLGGLLATAAVGAVVAGYFAGALDARLPTRGLSPAGRQEVAAAKRLTLGRPSTAGLNAAEATQIVSAARSASVSAFHLGVGIAAVLAALGGLIAAAGIQDPGRRRYEETAPDAGANSSARSTRASPAGAPSAASSESRANACTHSADDRVTRLLDAL